MNETRLVSQPKGSWSGRQKAFNFQREQRDLTTLGFHLVSPSLLLASVFLLLASRFFLLASCFVSVDACHGAEPNSDRLLTQLQGLRVWQQQTKNTISCCRCITLYYSFKPLCVRSHSSMSPFMTFELFYSSTAISLFSSV
jgi:hypothetical protein